MNEDTKTYNGHTYSGNLLSACIDGYKQGRSDKYQEITSAYMLLTENQVDEIRADERVKTIEDCKEVVRQHWINGTVAYRIAEEIYGSLERLKQK